jgi:hypothetical protein
MLEIPGEEAPTDPGLQAKKRQEEQAKVLEAAKSRKSRVVGVFALLALVGLGAAGAVAWQKSQEAVTYDDPNFFVLPLEDIAEAPPDAPPPPPSAAPTTAAPRGNGGGRKSPAVGGPTADVVAPPSGESDLLKRPTGERQGDAVGAAVTTALPTGGTGLGGGSIRIEQVGSDAVLTDPGEIREMIKRVIGALSPQVQACYTQRLKQVESLKGAWNVSFTITKAGGTSNVRAEGLNGSDAELEACMVRAVSTWRFQKVNQEFPVKKSYRFGAQSW